jgi:hypothetical protein
MSNELVLSDVMTLGKALSESKYFSDAKEASQAVVKVLAGQELGIGPVAAMSGLYIVKGKVTLSANIMASLIKSSQKYNYQIQDHSNAGCLIEFFENGQSVGTSEFTMEDAKTAKLAGGDNWKSYPKNMLFARALSNGAKWFCPDLFNGQSVYTPDEIEPEPMPDFVIENSNLGIGGIGAELEPEVEVITDGTAKREWIKTIKNHPDYPGDGSPIEKVDFINKQFYEKSLDFKITVKEVVDLEK